MRTTPLLPALFVFAVTVAFGQAQGHAPPKPSALTDAIKLVSPSIVRISYDMDQFPEETQRAVGTLFLIGPAGTGFIVNSEGYVVTALHVLSFFDQLSDGIPVGGRKYPVGRNRLLIELPLPNTDTKSLSIRGSFSMVPFTVVDTDPMHDLVLLKPQWQLFAPWAGKEHAASFSVARPEDGTCIAVSGYPLGKQVMVTTSGAVASSWDYEERQQPIPGRPGILLPETKDIFLVDMHVNHGNSGGPVYRVDTGAVIGVADAYALEDNVMLAPLSGGKPDPAYDQSGRALMTNAGLGVVVPARYVVELLKKNNLKWTER